MTDPPIMLPMVTGNRFAKMKFPKVRLRKSRLHFALEMFKAVNPTPNKLCTSYDHQNQAQAKDQSG